MIADLTTAMQLYSSLIGAQDNIIRANACILTPEFAAERILWEKSVKGYQVAVTESMREVMLTRSAHLMAQRRYATEQVKILRANRIYDPGTFPELDEEKPDLEPTGWWRVLTPAGEVWCETSDETEAREREKPGYQLERKYVRVQAEWRSQILCSTSVRSWKWMTGIHQRRSWS